MVGVDMDSAHNEQSITCLRRKKWRPKARLAAVGDCCDCIGASQPVEW